VSVSAVKIANYILKLSWLFDKPIGQMSLQRLTYIAHGWHFATLGNPLVNEPVRARVYGIFFKSIASTFVLFGSPLITKQRYKNAEIDYKRGLSFSFNDILESELSYEHEEVVSAVWRAMCYFSDDQIVSLICHKGSPWDKVVQFLGSGDRRKLIEGAYIPNYIISNYFKEILEAVSDDKKTNSNKP